MPILRDEPDPLASVIDWLDACRSRRIDTLLDLYAESATVECACDGSKSLTGRAALEAYWRPKLANCSADCFSINDINANRDGVILDYKTYDGKPIRIYFTFNQAGQISHTRCGPLVSAAA